jgi:hypothetical protein
MLLTDRAEDEDCGSPTSTCMRVDESRWDFQMGVTQDMSVVDKGSTGSEYATSSPLLWSNLQRWSLDVLNPTPLSCDKQA